MYGWSAYRFAADGAQSGGAPLILLSRGESPNVYSVSAGTGEATLRDDLPVQSGAFVSALDVSSCRMALGIRLCTYYWAESRLDGDRNCVASDAAIFRDQERTESTLFVGPPLRCPLAVRRAPDGTLLVLDGLLPSPFTAADLRVWRFVRDPATELWNPTLVAGSGQLPDATGSLPDLVVSTFAMPEPGDGALGAASLIGVEAMRRLRRRLDA